MNSRFSKSCVLAQVAALTILSFGCSSNKLRRPAGAEELTLSDVLENTLAVNKSLSSNGHSQCRDRYQMIYQQLYMLAGDSAYQDLNNVESIDQDIQASWEARLAMKEVFRDFKITNENDEACLKSASDVLRGLRYVEDYLIEIRQTRIQNPPEEYQSLKGEFPYLLVNPKYADEFQSSKDLRSGDVILSRGNAYSSAAIARIGSNDYQFSHLSFVYGDPDTKELYTTEAHIEIGSVTAPLNLHLDGKNAREAIFRFHEPDQARKASEAIYARVKTSQESGKNIEYDFSMNVDDDERLFCSEIVATGFRMIGDNTIPKFRSKFTAGMIPFLSDIGVNATPENIKSLKTFSPGDIQFDPRFDLVAEWRNPKKMEDSRIKDFILTKLFEKMEQESYRFDSTIRMEVESRAIWLMRRTPLVRKFLAEKLPLNMNPKQLQIFMLLDKIGEAIQKEVEVASLDYNRPLTPKEIYDTVDAYWAKDASLFKKLKKGQDVARPAFHQYFHP